MLLTELFDFTPIMYNINYCIRIVNEHQETILGNPRELFENTLAGIKTDLIDVAEKFRPQLNGLLKGDIDAELNLPLQERIKKAGEYFSDKLVSVLKEILAGFSVETDNKAVRKSFSEALSRIRKEGMAKLACLNAAKSGFTISKYLEAKAISVLDVQPVKTHVVKSLEDTSGVIQHPVVFKELKEWRNIKARELDLPHYMILPQKTMLTLANYLPQTMVAINSVKGMGKKKSEKYGGELLEIITSFCKKENIEPPAETFAEKKPKKIKEDTKKTSFDLFMSGKEVSQIALDRELNVNTIETHLAHYVSLGEIPIDRFVSKEIRELIENQFDGSSELVLGPVKTALGDRVSWSDIKFVASHLRFLRKNKG
jgi:hypothetical protein